jgi:outer membrane protein insertion porin family
VIFGRGGGSPLEESPLIFVGTWLVTLALMATSLTAQVPSTSDAGPGLIKDIVMEGFRRVPSWAILSRIQTRIGDEFSLSGVRDDVRAVFALGFFDDVQFRREELAEGGVRVIFVVVERPLVREVHFDGNRDVTIDELREHPAVRVGELYNPVAVSSVWTPLAGSTRRKGSTVLAFLQTQSPLPREMLA